MAKAYRVVPGLPLWTGCGRRPDFTPGDAKLSSGKSKKRMSVFRFNLIEKGPNVLRANSLFRASNSLFSPGTGNSRQPLDIA
jgi:hypothetical protein